MAETMNIVPAEVPAQAQASDLAGRYADMRRQSAARSAGDDLARRMREREAAGQQPGTDAGQKPKDRNSGNLPELGTQVIGKTPEGRPIVQNPDGSFSTERTETFQTEFGFVNIPTMFGGKQVSSEEAFDIMRRNNWIDPETGRMMDFFPDVKSAEAAARARSESIDVIGVKNEAEPGLLDTAGAVAKDVGKGIVASPREVIGGVVDAVKNAGQAGADLYQWFWGDLLGVEDPTGFKRFMEGQGAKFDLPEGADPGEVFFNKVIESIPNLPPSDTVTGGLIRSTAQFLAGFIGSGKFVGTAREAGSAVQILNGMMRGAIADATVFDPQQENLANLLKQHTELAKPVTDFLATDPNDSDAENRFRNVLLGLGMGALTEGFVLSLRALRDARIAKAGGRSPEQMARMGREFDEAVKPRLADDAFNALGNPADDLLRTKVRAAVKAGKGKSAADLVKAADDIDIRPDIRGAQGDVFINWSRVDTPVDVKALVQAAADQAKGSITKATRGIRTHAETQLSAGQIDAWDLLATRRVGQALNAEESLALRNLWAASGEKLHEVARLAVQNPSPANRFMAEKMMAVHHMVMNEVIGVRTETARALNQWRIPAGGAAEKARAIDDILTGWHGADQDVTTSVMQRIAALADAGMYREMDEMAYKGVFARTRDAVAQVWINSLLSSPHTHMRNMISQTAVIGQQIYERRAAAMLGSLSGRTAERVADGEATQLMFGLVEGLKDSFRVTAKGRRILGQTALDIGAGKGARRGLEAMRANPEEFGTVLRSAATGKTGIGVGKVELPRTGALSSEAWRVARDSPVGRALDWIDTASQIPGRALGVEDELFKTIGYRMELRAQALRQATQEVHAGKIAAAALKDRIAEIIANPPENIRMGAADMAMYVTFTNQPAKIPMDVVRAIGRVPVLGRIVMPFRRTPVNLATYSFERTPLAPLIGQWRADVAAGGARRDIALARLYTGTAILLASADLAMNGVLTGEGPVDPRQRAGQRRQGVQPLSVRVATGPGEDDYRYFSFRGMEPVATSLGLAANIVDILVNTEWQGETQDKDVDEMIIAASMAIAKQVTSQQYMTGVSDFFDAMSDPQRYGEAWWKRLAGSVVPSGVANLNRTTMDPYMRAAYDMADAIRARTPGLSQDLPLRHDLWGRPIDRRSGLGGLYDFISPVYSSKYAPEPIDKEFDRLGYWPGRLPKKVSFDGMVVNMERYPEQRAALERLAGNELKLPQYGNKGAMDALNDIIGGKSPFSVIYRMKTDGPDGGKAAMLRKIVGQYRDAAKKKLLREDETLRTLYDEERRKRLRSPGGIKLQ